MHSLDRPGDGGSPSPFLFLVGCPRSGTTLLQRLLDAHPSLTVANDTHFITRAIDKVAGGSVVRASSPLLKESLVEWTRGYHRFGRLGLDAEAVARADEASTTYPEFVAGLYRQLAALRGKELAGEKTPDYIRHIGRLHAMFPASKLVHIVRDGRDVALSLLDWAHEAKGPGRLELWRHQPVATCALWWRWQVTGQRRGLGMEPGSFVQMRYEDLVRDPSTTLRSLTEWLGIPFDRRMLRFNEGKVRRQDGLSAKKAWLGPTPGLRDWRSQLDVRSLALFEALAGDVLEDNGYRLALPRIPKDLRAVADECRLWWETSGRETDQVAPHRGAAADGG